jgi:curved DNA-binding protein CbpA
VFIRLTEAYRTLSDPEQRARYDAQHRQNKQLRWNIFDQARTTAGLEGEQRKRQGILEMLYAKTLHDPERASITLFEFEDMLGCPREHLQAALWFLRGKGFIKSSDNGRHVITVQGFEEAEKNPSAAQPLGVRLLKPADRN